MGLEDACLMFSAREKTSELGSKSQWRELFEKAVMETKNGASITADLIVVVGRKVECSGDLVGSERTGNAFYRFIGA